jgi:modulator of FtsH protease HflK
MLNSIYYAIRETIDPAMMGAGRHGFHQPKSLGEPTMNQPRGPQRGQNPFDDALNSIKGGSAKRSGGIALGAVIVVLLIWAALSSFYTVQPEERAVVKRFGAVIKINDPGLHFRLPFGIDQVQLVATERVLKQEFGFRTEGMRGGRTAYSGKQFEDESLMLTGDLNIIDLEWVVQYRISDPIKFLYEMREPTRTLRDISESVMRRVVGNRLGSDVLTIGRVDIQLLGRDEIQQIMDRYDAGIHVITVELQDVVPPPAVQPAFNEVNEARQERERMINEAQKRVNQEIPRAEGQAMRTIAEAEGYATERVNRSLGESVRFSAVLAEYRQAPEVTRSRLYLETMEEILPGVGQILVVQDDQIAPLPLLNVERARAQEARQ